MSNITPAELEAWRVLCKKATAANNKSIDWQPMDWDDWQILFEYEKASLPAMTRLIGEVERLTAEVGRKQLIIDRSPDTDDIDNAGWKCEFCQYNTRQNKKIECNGAECIEEFIKWVVSLRAECDRLETCRVDEGRENDRLRALARELAEHYDDALASLEILHSTREYDNDYLEVPAELEAGKALLARPDVKELEE